MDWDEYKKDLEKLNQHLKEIRERIAKTREARLEREKQQNPPSVIPKMMEDLAKERAAEQPIVYEFTFEERLYWSGKRDRTKQILKELKKEKGALADVIDIKTRQRI